PSGALGLHQQEPALFQPCLEINAVMIQKVLSSVGSIDRVAIDDVPVKDYGVCLAPVKKDSAGITIAAELIINTQGSTPYGASDRLRLHDAIPERAPPQRSAIPVHEHDDVKGPGATSAPVPPPVPDRGSHVTEDGTNQKEAPAASQEHVKEVIHVRYNHCERLERHPQVLEPGDGQT